ncbi:peptidoglycan-binding protein [Sporolactobacillus sp. THM7-4]|nr:peptidoglycan-binding protein [Sporolactobacillus sp. THM7-4]
MYTGNVMVKGAVVAAAFTSSFFLPQSAAAHFTSDELLYKGMHHPDVVTLQSYLKTTGDYPYMKPTGFFGSSTEKAVKQFQKENGLVVDGLVGKQTKRKLVSVVHRNMDMIALGSTGEDVRYLQGHLKRNGFYAGALDGRFGHLTQRAVINLQTEARIKVDGIVGPQTWGSIEQINDKGRESVHKQYHKEIRRKSGSGTSDSEENHTIREKTAEESHPVRKKTKVLNHPNSTETVKEFYVSSTGYTAYCSGCSGTTATGIDLRKNPNIKIVAVDPSFIPLGTKLYVEGYGYAIAGDTGGAIKGRKIDLLFSSNSDALQWGRRTVKVKVVE